MLFLVFSIKQSQGNRENQYGQPPVTKIYEHQQKTVDFLVWRFVWGYLWCGLRPANLCMGNHIITSRRVE